MRSPECGLARSGLAGQRCADDSLSDLQKVKHSRTIQTVVDSRWRFTGRSLVEGIFRSASLTEHFQLDAVVQLRGHGSIRMDVEGALQTARSVKDLNTKWSGVRTEASESSGWIASLISICSSGEAPELRRTS